MSGQSGSGVQGAIGSCTTRPTATHTSTATPTPTPTSTATVTNACTPTVLDLSSGIASRKGTWSGSCSAQNHEKPGSYARYYSFTLSKTKDVTIELSSDVDSELILVRPSGSLFKPLPNSGQGRNERIKESLTAVGTYTIIATTAAQRMTGDFLLTVGTASSSDFKISASVIKKDGLDLGSHEDLRNFQWKVFTSASFEVTAMLGAAKNPTAYEFELDVPRSTGLQIANRPDAECEWASAPSRPTSQKKRSAGRPSTHNPNADQIVFYLVRCGIGDGESVIQLKAWRGATRVATDFIMPVPQSWHDADHSLIYQVNCNMLPANVDHASAIRAAATAWNNANTGVAFTKFTARNCDSNNITGKVNIKTYTPSSQGGKCGIEGLACAFRSGLSNSLLSLQYPHTATQEILIKDTLLNRRTWTASKKTDGTIGMNQYYLPLTMMHELGHAAGLGHSGADGDIMDVGQARGEVKDTPEANDISAMKSIYQHHSSHR